MIKWGIKFISIIYRINVGIFKFHVHPEIIIIDFT